MQDINGYRNLTQTEIDLINEIKEKGNELRVLYNKLGSHVGNDMVLDPTERRRWLAIGRTNYQQGLMALTRAIAAPLNE